jgi:hypothetical protein
MWFLLLLSLLITPVHAIDSTVSAQNATPSVNLDLSATPTPPLFDQYKKDYLYQYDLYNQAYLNYIDKKQVHTKYGTITTQKEKFTAAVDTINARNKALKSYLLALRVMLDDYKDSNPTITEKVKIDLSKWEAWFNEQLTVVPAINNDDDLKKWADDFKNKYITIQPIIYTALTQHEINLRTQTLSLLQDVANDIKNDPNIKPESQQWISSLTVKSDLVNTSLNNALNATKKNQYQNKFVNFYPDAKLEINKATGYLREIGSDLKLTIIKFLTK